MKLVPKIVPTFNLQIRLASMARHQILYVLLSELERINYFYSPWNHQEAKDALGKDKSIKRLEFLNIFFHK